MTVIELETTDNNEEIKQLLRLYGISYTDLAKRLLCHRQTVYTALCHPLKQEKYALYKSIVEKIIEEKKVSK